MNEFNTPAGAEQQPESIDIASIMEYLITQDTAQKTSFQNLQPLGFGAIQLLVEVYQIEPETQKNNESLALPYVDLNIEDYNQRLSFHVPSNQQALLIRSIELCILILKIRGAKKIEVMIHGTSLAHPGYFSALIVCDEQQIQYAGPIHAINQEKMNRKSYIQSIRKNGTNLINLQIARDLLDKAKHIQEQISGRHYGK